MLLAAPDVPLPSRSAVDRARRELEARLGPSKVVTDRAACEPFARDDSDAEGRVPDAVVFAETADDIVSTLAIAERFEVPVTPRAGGSGRTGGAVPVAGGIVLATERLRTIKEINRTDLVAVVEPGVVTSALQAAVEAEGLFFPPDPSSLDWSQIGGNVAENAGGPRAFKYGVTRDYVLGLTTHLVGGRTVRAGRRTAKGVTGYDVTALLVGSEGTLGVFSEVTLRLVPKPPALATVLAFFGDVHASGAAVSALVSRGIVPRCLELLDEATVNAVRAQGVAIPVTARGLLLIEVDGLPRAVEEALEILGNALAETPGVLEVVAAQDEGQRARLWAARRALSPAVRKLAKYKLSEDVVVPRARLSSLLHEVERISHVTGVRMLSYGHAGDGNLHVNFLWNHEDERPAVNGAIFELMKTTVALGGTLSGEHGIGLAKAAYLPLEQSPELIALQESLKGVFDPKGLLNPGKIFPTRGHRVC